MRIVDTATRTVYEAHLQPAVVPAPARADHPQLRFLARHVPDDRESRILDAGCGNGQYSYALHHMGYRNLAAVDLFDSIGLGNLVDYRRASIADIPWPDASFDLIFSSSVIYLLDDPGEGIREFRRLLRPGGVLVFSAHPRYSLFTLDRRCRRLLGGAAHLRGARFRSAYEYNRLLRGAGLEVQETDGFGLLYSPFRLGTRVMKKIHRELFHGREPFAGSAAARALRSIVGYHSLHAARRRA